MLAPLSRLLLDLHPALLLLLLLDFLLRSSCCTAGAPRARSRGTCAATTHGDSRQATAAAQTGCVQDVKRARAVKAKRAGSSRAAAGRAVDSDGAADAGT